MKAKTLLLIFGLTLILLAIDSGDAYSQRMRRSGNSGRSTNRSYNNTNRSYNTSRGSNTISGKNRTNTTKQ
ncbi:MAG: hypothetical protein JNJ56_10065, partial [Ignavibacteria bacterium]|nr:hypothetical protein [Ignavibacteria bacterium]